jgi:hypothetical protein
MGGHAEIIDARDHGAHRREDCPLQDGSKVPRFRASDETRQRWWKQRRVGLGLALAASAVFVALIASDGIHSSFALTALIVFVCLAVQLVSIDGQFLGPQRHLMDALARSPFGQPAH